MVDASVVVTGLVDEGGDGALARERLGADDVHVPELADVEVLSALRRRTRSGDLSPRRAAEALADYSELRLERYPHLALLPRAWELRATVSAHDAQYVALAELLGAPLVTADGRLSRAAGPRCRIDLLG